jgi:flagellar motor switch protein FliG
MPANSTDAELNGAQKAAVLMLALGEEQSSRLFGMMHEDEIKEVSAAMAQLGSVKAEMVERLCVDFSESMGGMGHLVGSFESTERLLQRVPCGTSSATCTKRCSPTI